MSELEPCEVKKVINSVTINLDESMTRNMTYWFYQNDVCIGTCSASEAVEEGEPAPQLVKDAAKR